MDTLKKFDEDDEKPKAAAAAACANNKGILAFLYLIYALCRRVVVPTSPGDKYQPNKTGWTRATYMRKMDVADTTPLNVAMPTPPASPIQEAAAPSEEVGPSAPAAQAEPQRTPPASPPVVSISSHTTTTSPATTPAAREHSRACTPDTPLGTTLSSPSPPASAQSDEAAPPLHILQLRSQLQRIEAKQIHFQEEMKVFNTNLIKFLHFQFPSAASFFAQPSTTPPQPIIFVAAQPSANMSAKAGATEEVNFSSDDENDVFNWQSPHDHLQPLGPTTTPAPAVPILSAAPTPATSAIAERPTPDSPARRKGKATTGKTFGRDIPSSPEDEAEQRLAKRMRNYHVITADSCKEAVLGLHHMKKDTYTLKKRINQKRDLAKVRKIMCFEKRTHKAMHPLCHPVEAEHQSTCIEEVEALTVDSEAIID
ncbi:hypothetical protein GQ457_15G015600 [Hibiscus cannabinus]